MSSLGGLVTAIGGATGDKGTYSLLDLTKSQPIQGALDSLISNYTGQTAQDSTDLNQFIKNWVSGQGQAQQNTGEETQAIDRYYNGDVARQLADLRAQQSQLGNQSVAQALAYQRGNQNRSLVAGGGGGGSYTNRLALDTAGNLNLQNALLNVGQERSDVNAVNTAQTNLVGQRQSLANALAQRPLVPAQASQDILGGNIQDLNQLTAISNANNMFGAQYNPSMAEYGGQITGDVMGGGGGGGAGGAAFYNPNTGGWSGSPGPTGGGGGGGGGSL